MEFCKAFHSVSLLVLPTNIRLGRQSMQVANTLAYYDTAINTAVKSFIVQAPVLSRHLWQLKAVVFLHWRLICVVPLSFGELLFGEM